MFNQKNKYAHLHGSARYTGSNYCRTCGTNASKSHRRRRSRVGSKDTPWAYRDAKYAGVIVGVDPDPKNADKITKWCKEYYDALHPYSAGGAYTNFMMDEGQERVKAIYKHNYERLVTIKRKFDPQNVFKVNQNIRPS